MFKFPQAQVRFIQDASSLSNELPLFEASEAVLNEIKDSSKHTRIILMGHSRGGAVAELSALREPSRVSAVVLIDPVDDSSTTFINSLIIRSCHPTNLPPHLVISTPFGGRSSYYKYAKFTSSCAPEGRNADAIWKAFKTCTKNPGAFVKFPELGHFQLFNAMDESESSALANVCPSNDRMPQDAIVAYKNLTYTIICRFLELVEGGDALESKLEASLSEALDSTARFRPALSFEWETSGCIVTGSETSNR